MLTIYIPTYNRKEYLENLLEKLFDEVDSIKGLEKFVRIHVSDNCSKDETRALLESKNKSYFTYSIFDKNIGGDKNIRNSIDVCETRYLWILGDDDFPMPGVLEFVTNSLASLSPNLLYLPAVWSLNAMGINDDINVRRNAVNLDVNNFIKLVNVKITFISSFIVDVNDIHSSVNSSFQALVAGSNFEQLAVYFPHILGGDRLFICDSNCIYATGNNSFKYAMVNAFGVDLPYLLRRMLVSRPDLLRVILNRLIIGYLPGFIAVVRSNKNHSGDLIPWNAINQQLSDFFMYWIIIAPMRYMPVLVSRVWAILFRFAR